jgi:predicted ABC-type ATPase
MKKKRKPTCYVIAGPNGAGKTTFALKYLPEIAGCRNFVNADLIAYGLSPFDSLSAQYEAGRLFLREINANIEKRADFAFETTLAGRSYISLLKRLKSDGWRIVLFFLWLPGPDFSRSRVRERVEHGGHDIPDDTIDRRYPRIMRNLIQFYLPMCDKVVFYDASTIEPIRIFEQDGRFRRIFIKSIYESILRGADE